MLPGTQMSFWQERSILPHSFSKHETSPCCSPAAWTWGTEILSLKLHMEISVFLTSDTDHLLPNGRKILIKISPDQSRNAKWTFQKCAIIKKTHLFCVLIHFLTLAVTKRMKIQARNTEQGPCHGIFHLPRIWRHILNRIFCKKTSYTEVSFHWM